MTTYMSFTATQLKNETGRVLDHAMRAPVKLTSHGRSKAYIVPADVFERLMRLEDAQLAVRAERARKRGMIGPDASMALLRGLVDASNHPLPRRRKSAAQAAGKASAPTRRKVAKPRK